MASKKRSAEAAHLDDSYDVPILDEEDTSDEDERPTQRVLSSHQQKKQRRDLDPAELLQDLLDSIAEDDHRGYKQFLHKTGAQRVKDGLLASLRDPVRQIIQWKAYLDTALLKSIIGQARVLRIRITDHESKLRNGNRNCLHYDVAVDRKPHSVVLAILDPAVLGVPADEDLSMWLNICEAWMAILFQTLPRVTLTRFLGPHQLHASEIGLNVASPLNQGHSKLAAREAHKLSKSTDPLAKRFYEQHILPQTLANLAKGREAARADEFRGIIKAKRAGSRFEHLKRTSHNAREQFVLVMCHKCKDPKSAKYDPDPEYEIASGKYIVRGMRCHGSCTRVKKNKRSQQFHEPVDPTIRKIRERQVDRKPQGLEPANVAKKAKKNKA